MSEKKKVRFHGIIPPMATLFDDNGGIDWEANAKLIEFLIENGVHGIMVQGSMGEFTHMSKEERKEFAQFAVKQVNGRVPLIVGTGSSSTDEAIELSQYALEAGADGVMVVNPFYWSLSDENIYRHFAKVAQNVDGAILLYNIPMLTGQNIPVSVIKRLADEFENIVGIKETVDSIGHIRDVILQVKSTHPEFSVLAAYDDHVFPALAIGADGAICGTSNFVPQITVGVYNQFKQGNYQDSMKLHQSILPFMQLYGVDTPPIGVMKEAIKLVVGGISNFVRSPGSVVQDEHKQLVSQLLSK